MLGKAFHYGSPYGMLCKLFHIPHIRCVKRGTNITQRAIQKVVGGGYFSPVFYLIPISMLQTTFPKSCSMSFHTSDTYILLRVDCLQYCCINSRACGYYTQSLLKIQSNAYAVTREKFFG